MRVAYTLLKINGKENYNLKHYIAVYSQELLLKPMEGNNRLEMYEQFMSMFEPHGVVDIAFETDKRVVE